MRPPMVSEPPRVPVTVLRVEMLIQCPQCLGGLGFIHGGRMEPGQGCQLRCTKCNVLYGFQPYFVRLDAPKRLIL